MVDPSGNPETVALVTATRAIVTNARSPVSVPASVAQCELVGGGSLGSCAATTASNTFVRPTGVAILGSTAFVVDEADKTANAGFVSQCALDASGVITSCVVPPVASWLLSRPYGIAIQNNIAYIPSNTANAVTRCTISAAGSITSCSDSPPTNGLGW